MSAEVDKNIEVNSLFSNKYIEDGFSSTKLVEKTEKMTLPFAVVNAQNWWFDGIVISYSDWQFKEDFEIEWKGDLNVVTLFFNLRGKIVTDVHVYGKDFELGNYQHNLFYSSNSKGKIKNHDLRLTNFMIQFTVEAFMKLTDEANDVLKQFAENVSKGESGTLSATNLYLDAKMLHVIENILNCRYSDGLKKMYLHSKCLELLVMQAEAYNNSLKVSSSYIKNDYDKECILYAREYLLEHIELPPSLSELSKIAGINEFKLKKGFKEMFGNTVFGYLSDSRLEIAKTDLLERKKTVVEIATELGYSSPQHFSNAFKKKFGISPSRFKS